ncbi:MAG: class I SAM-dependent methyltransferase [Candidatus Omnitrophica bacterium]|nr:class I SAM-dependent methyltransferase [Candidatus Omnitrophota bacterium]
MEKAASENHKKYLKRKSLYKSFGYDIDKERGFIIEKAGLFHGKILEAGTGKGHFALALAKKGYEFTTFDISEKEQKFAKLNLKYFGLNHSADFRIENGEQLSFKDSSFDVIFSVNTIHHLLNPYQVINELIRVLSVNGKLVLSDFTKEGQKVMDKIHAAQGNKHEIGKATLSDIHKYLINKGFKTKKYRSRFQEVLLACRQSV